MIKETLLAILDQVSKLPVPSGEGLERQLRALLRDQFLQEELGWNRKRIASGEIYDLLCYDDDLVESIYWETKDPTKKIPKRGIDDALTRSEDLPGLKYTVVTNGSHWLLFDLEDETRRPLALQLHPDTDEQKVDQFFRQLRAAAHQKRITWAKEHRTIPADTDEGRARLAEGLRQSVDLLSTPLQELFHDFACARIPHRTFRSLLNHWQLISQRLQLAAIEEEFDRSAEVIASSPRERRELQHRRQVTRLARMTELETGCVEDALNRLLLLQQRTQEVTADRRELFYELLTKRNDVKVLNDQTAHIITGRLLLYRVAEDRDLIPRKLSGENIEKQVREADATATLLHRKEPVFLDRYLSSRAYMEDIYPDLFRLALYDWWRLDATTREALSPNERRMLFAREKKIDQAIRMVLRILNRFDLRYVQSDVWREVYQEYMPRADRLRLGGFYTEEELVSWLLELAQYDGADILDPACGSGTFLVEALPLIRARAEQLLTSRSKSKRAMDMLDTIASSLMSIDIHPFAVFLTHMNLLFLTIDLFERARAGKSDYTMGFNVFQSDYLERPEHEQPLLEGLEEWAAYNARAKEALRQHDHARTLKMTRPSFIVGNPPWGGVLRTGRPLQERGRYYKKRYKAARGKYDIYVLFFERALEQAKPGGVVAFVSQNRYLVRDYGKAVRKLMVGIDGAEATSVDIVVDLGEVGGKLFFPGQTNYPCLTVLRKKDLTSARLVRVSPKGPYEVSDELKRKLRATVLAILEELLVTEAVQRDVAPGIEVVGMQLPQSTLRQWARNEMAWEISPLMRSLDEITVAVRERHETIDLPSAFSVSQGATPGGQRMFLVDPETVQRLQLEQPAIHKALRGRHIYASRLQNDVAYVIYPYRFAEGTLRLINLGRNIWVGSSEEARRKVGKAIALGQIEAPNVALHLVGSYRGLADRTFEGKRLDEIGKEWYEWHRPRDPQIIACRPKIVVRRQVKEACFAVDEQGRLALDSVVVVVPKRHSEGWQRISQYLARALRRKPHELEVLQFVVAVLNHPVNEDLLKFRNVPHRGGYYTVGDEQLARLVVPLLERKDQLNAAARMAAGELFDATGYLSLDQSAY